MPAAVRSVQAPVGTPSPPSGPDFAAAVAEAGASATALAACPGRIPGRLPFGDNAVIADDPGRVPFCESVSSLARRWKRPRWTVEALVHRGLMRRVRNLKNYPLVLVDSSRWPTVAAFFRDWESQLPMLDAFADFDEYDAVRSLCGLDGTFSRFALDCMFNFIGEMGSFGDAELRTVTSIPTERSKNAGLPGFMTKEVLLKAVRETSGRRCRDDRRLDLSTPATLEALRRSLPEGLRDLPRTVLDPDFGEDYRVLPGRAPARSDGDHGDDGDGGDHGHDGGDGEEVGDDGDGGGGHRGGGDRDAGGDDEEQEPDGSDGDGVAADVGGSADADSAEDGYNAAALDDSGLILPAAIIRRLLALRSEPVRLVATVWVLIHRAQRPFSDPHRIVVFAETVDDLFEGADVLDAEVVAKRLWAYMGERSVSVCDAPWAVLGVGLFWRGHRTVLEAYAANNAGVADAVLALLLPPPEERLIQLVREMRCKADAGEKERRRKHVKPLARSLPERLAAMRNRARQARRMQRECERATAKRIELAERRPDGLPAPFGFSYVEDVIGTDGLRRAGRQTICMVAWPDETAIAEVEAACKSPNAGDWYGGERRDRYQFVGVEAEDPTVEAVEPWFVEFFRYGALCSGARLPADVRERRRRLIIDRGLPNQAYRPGGLCVTGCRREGHVMLMSLVHLGWVVIPIAALAHGMVMGCVLAGVIAKSLARVGEVMQMRKEDEGWRFKQVRGRWRVGFWAIPKNKTARRAFRVDDRVLRELRWLRLVTESRDGLDDIPVVAPEASLVRKCVPGRFVFSFRGRALPSYSLHFLLRVLCAGLGRCLPHDLRHAGARFARRNGGTRKGVGMRLDHAEGSELTEWYSGMLDEIDEWEDDDEDGDGAGGGVPDDAGDEDADEHFADLDRDGVLVGDLEDEEECA